MNRWVRTKTLIGLSSVCLFSLGLSACFSQNLAEGRFAESSSSGRVTQYEDGDHDLDSIRVMRVNLVQFDEAGAGIIELFTLKNHTTLAQKPRTQVAPSDNYFCTRLEQVSVENERMIFRFVDWLNRTWEVNGRLKESGDVFEGRFDRVGADGEVVVEPLHLLPEDQVYFAQGGDPDQQLILERTDDEVTEDDVQCVDFRRSDEFVLQFSSLPAEMTRPRIALVVTRAATSSSAEQPLNGLSTQREILTASLEPIDMVDGDRRLLKIRIDPARELMNDIGDGIASGTWVVYDDLDGDDEWDNLRFNPDTLEPVLAHANAQLLMFNQSSDPLTRAPRDETGRSSAVALFQSVPRVAGWQMYGFFGRELELPDGSLVWLVDELQGEPGPAAEIVAVPESCGFCYPAPSTLQSNIDSLPDGVPTPDCSECPPVLPLLFL